MAIVLTKGSMTNGDFTPADGSWFFENPYWNNDGSDDFVIKVENTGNTTAYLGGFTFTFQIADSEGQSFPSDGGSDHIAGGNNCTMQVSISAGGRTYYGTSWIVKDPNLVFHYDSRPGESYWEPRPGPAYKFVFDGIVPLAPNSTYYVHFQAGFTSGPGENCIQISSYDTVTVLPSYTVTYKLNGGSYAGSTSDYSKTVVQGGRVDPPGPVTKSGFDFDGWSPNDENWKNVQQDLTYTAQWRQSTVTATFYRNQKSDDNRIIQSGQVNIGTTLANAKPHTNPTWINAVGDGVTETPEFRGWSGSRGGTPYTPQQEQEQTIKANRNFYAQWSIPNIYFYQNLTAQDDELLGHGVASADSLVGAEGAPILEDPPPHYEYPENRIRLGIPCYDEYEYMHIKGINVYRQVMESIRTVLANSTDPLVFYGWRKDRQYHILEAGQDCTCLDLRECIVNSDDNQNKYYAVWKKAATIWVRENGIWVKKLNVRKYKASSHTWDEMPPKERSNGGWVDKS